MECDVPTFYQTTEPTARKQHQCCECGAPILAGEKYVCCRGKWDGVVSTFRQHALCCQACEVIRELDGECIGFGCLMEWWGESGPHGQPCYEKDIEPWKTLRGLMARIMWRHRNGAST